MAKRKQAGTLDPTEQDQAQKHDTGNEVAIDIEELKHDKNALEDILRRRDKWKECIQIRVQAQADEKAAKDSMIEAIDSANEWKNADAPLYKQNPEWASKPLTEIGLSDHIVGKIEGGAVWKTEPVKTVGQLVEWIKAGNNLMDIKGIGDQAADQISDAVSRACREGGADLEPAGESTDEDPPASSANAA